MKISKLMNRDVVSILPTATLHDAAMKMKEEGIGSILICEEGLRLKGILTDRDIGMAVAAEFRDPRTTIASDIMKKEPVTIESDADMDSALRLMSKSVIRRLPVCENGKVIGMLSMSMWPLR